MTLTSSSAFQTAPRSVPRIARTRKTIEIGIPTAAAIHSDRLRPLTGTSGARGTAPARGMDESGTTVTLEASSEVMCVPIREGRGRP
jgi:hypothetical protein